MPIFRRTIEVQPTWVERARTREKAIVDWWVPQWREMEKNYRFYAGHVFTEEQLKRARDALKFLLVFNNYPTIVNSATGREVVNRYRPALKGRERGKKIPEIEELLRNQFGIEDLSNDPHVAQALTEYIRLIEQDCEADSEISDAFLDTFLCGVGVTETLLDPMEEVEGKIKTVEVSPWDVGWDLDSRKRNFRDAVDVFRWKYVSLDEALEMFPDKADELVSAAEDTRFHIPAKAHAKEDRPHYRADDAGHRQFFNPRTYQVQLTDYQFKEKADLYLFVDPETGADRQVRLGELRSEFRRWKSVGIPAPAYDRVPQWVYRRGWLAGQTPLVDEPEDLPIPGFTLGAITCYPWKSPKGVKWFGPGHLGRDPQKWQSKYLSLQLDLVGTSPKAPVIVQRDAIGTDEEVEEFRREITRPDGMPVVKDKEGIILGRPPNFSTGLQQMAEFATGGIWQSMGMSQLSAGILDDPRRAPFQTVNAVMQAGQSVYAMPFDALRFHRRDLARKYLHFIQGYVDPIRVLRSVGHDYVEGIIQLVRNEGGVWVWDEEAFGAAMRFDLVADESPVTPNAMVALLNVFTDTNFFALLQQGGMAPPLEVIVEITKAAGLPATLAEQWLQDPSGIPVESQQAIIGQFLAQLPPEIQQIVQEAIQAAQQQPQEQVQ